MAAAFEFKKVEKFSSTIAPKPMVLEIHVSPNLPERRIYSWFDTKSTAPGANQLIAIEADIVCYSDQKGELGRIPVNISQLGSSAAGKSYESLVNAGGTPVGDSMILNLPVQLNAGVSQIALQPFRFNADDVNRITLEVKRVYDANALLSGYHIFLGCVSVRF